MTRHNENLDASLVRSLKDTLENARWLKDNLKHVVEQKTEAQMKM